MNFLIYNNSYGEIKWTDPSFLTDLSISGSDLGLGNNILIENNTIAFNSAAFFGYDTLINSSTNITLYGISLTSVDQIKKLSNYTNNRSEIAFNGQNCNGTSCQILSYSSNTLVFNTSGFSSFTGYENVAGDVPTWQNNFSSTVETYSSLTSSYFNITWLDDYSISSVYLESNYSGVATNYSMNRISGTTTNGVYNYSEILPAGDHYWKSYANDSVGQWNFTDSWTFTIAQNTDGCNVLFNETSLLTYPNTFKAYSDCTTSFILYQNGTIIDNNSEQSLGAGTYNFTVIRADSTNYSNYYDEETFVISSTSSSVSLTLNGSAANITINQGITIDLNCSIVSGEGDIYLYQNGALINSGTSPLSNATLFNTDGSYNITCLYQSTQNYSAISQTYWVNVTANNLPSVTTPVITPSEAYTNNTLTTSTYYSDSEGSNGTIYFLWYVDNVNVFNQTNESVTSGTTVYSSLHYNNFSKNNVVNVSIYANDTFNFSTTVWSNSVTILNTVPVFDQNLSSQSINYGTLFTYDVNCSDLDSDSVTYYDDYANFEINTTTGLINYTPTANEYNSDYVNITCSDGESNISELFLYSVTDGTDPSFSNPVNTSSGFKRYQNFTANITITDVSLQSYLFSTNASGSWTNTSLRTLSETEYSASEQANISLAKNNEICWYYWGNDTTGNTNVSDTYCFIVRNTGPQFNQSLTAQAAYSDQAFSYQVNCSDVDTDSIVYYDNTTLFNIGATGTISDTPSESETGAYSINISCDDGEENISQTFTYTINDITTPVFTSISNQTIDNETVLSVQFTASDASGVNTWSVNDTTNFQINNSGYLTNVTGLIVQNYWLNITINDSYNNQNSQIIYVNVTEAVPISVNLISPINNYVNNTSPVNVTFICNVTAGNDLENITVYVWNTTAEYATNTTSVGGTSNQTSAEIELVEGTYYWNCLAYNNQSESNWASSNRTVIVDVTYPIVELSTPTVDSGSVVNQNYILANVTVTETNFVNLSYYVYTPVGILYQNYTLTALPYNWTFTSLNDGTYYYNATICDLAGNCNSSSTYNITLDTTSPAIDYQTPATTTGNYSQDYIEANITASDSNLGTIILYLYNSTGLVQSNTSVSSPLFINFTSLDDGTYYVNATVNDTVGLTNYTSTRTIILDTTEPDVTALLPIADSTYRVNNLIQLGANITDTTLSVDTVKANITYPNGTSNLITLSQVGATSQYNNSFTIPYLNGSYNVTIIANDTVNNINSTENTYFNAEIHGINITQPNNQTTNNITSVNYTFTITNNGTGVDSYTITKTDTSGVGTLNQSTITNLAAGSSVQLILTVNSTIVGNYTVTVNVTSSNYTDVFALSSVTTEVLSGPLITSTSIVPYALINGSNVDLYVSAINNQSVWAVITLPNSTETVMDLNNNVNTSFSITELMGRHNVTFWVNDSYGATDNSTDYFETFEPITFNVTIIDFNDSAVNTTLRTDYRNTLLNTTNTTTGNFSEVWPNTLLDLQFNSYLNRLRVTFTGFNLSQNNGLSLGLDKLSTALSGYLGTYGINSSYNFTNATLRLYYDDLSYTNEGYLGLYTCNDWLFANQTCNGTWVDITSNATQSTSSDYFEYNTTSFSGFSIKQETVPSVPSGSSGSSGGGGGGGGGAAGLTYLISGEQFNAGYQKELSIGDRFKFNVGKETHYLTLNQTYENRIVVIVESQPHTATIYFNKTKYFELTGDQVYDLSVKVEDINHIGSKATLTMKSVAVPISSIPDEEIEPVTVLEPISEEILAPLELEEENLSVKKSEFSKILLLILIVVVVLIVLFFLGHYFYKHPPKTSWPHISRPRFNLFRSKKKSVSERNKSVINTENKTSRKSNVKKNKEEKQDIKPMFANLFKLNLKDYLRRLRYLPKTIKKVERDAHKFIFHGFSFQEAFDKALSGKKISEDKIRPILEKLKITTKIAQKYHFDERKGKQFIDFVKSELRRHESIETIAKELVEGGMSQADALEFVNVYNKHQ